MRAESKRQKTNGCKSNASESTKSCCFEETNEKEILNKTNHEQKREDIFNLW